MALYVDDEKIDEGEIQAEVEKLRGDYERVFAEQPAEQRAKQLHEWSRENVIERVLLRQAALADKQEIPDEQIEKAYRQITEQAGGEERFYQNIDGGRSKQGQVKKNIAQQLRVERLLSKIADNAAPPTEKAIRRHYEKNLQRFTIPEMVRASHIVKHPDAGADIKELHEQMQQIRADIHNKDDFGKTATEQSSCPENAGDLGFFPRGQMVQEFEDVVFAMETGQISDVFLTQFGYHIAMVTDKKPSIQCSLKDVREVIIKELGEQARQKAIEKFIDTCKAKARIEEK